MSCSGAFKSFLAVALLLSIAWKMVIPSEDDPTHSLIEFLKRNHFDVVVTTVDVPTIRAQSGSCRLQVVRLDANGSNQDLIGQLAKGTDRSFIVFRGQVYDQQPIFLTQINYIWSKRLREFGLVKHLEPLIAVAANASCNAEKLPWHELGKTS